jgi:hypothetical protein
MIVRLRLYSLDWCSLPIASASFGLALCLLLFRCHAGLILCVGLLSVCHLYV